MRRSMNQIVAFCGLDCTKCRGFIATQKDDYELRREVAESWSTENEKLKAEDINCDGCLPGGKRILRFCHLCEVRKCGMARRVKNCAYCDEYPCGRLEGAWKMMQAEEARMTLDKIRRRV